MRTRHHTSGPAWKEPCLDDGALMPPMIPPAPVQTSALDLPGEQRFGLVFLRKAGPDSLASKIIKHLNETGVPFPVGRHWFELRREGYVTRERTGHKLTPRGLHASSDIMRDLAKKFAIHHITRSGGRGSGTTVTCSCGKFGAGPFATSNGGESRLTTAIGRHFKDIEAGPRNGRPLHEFLNEVAPPRFDFTSAGGPRNGATGRVSESEYPVAPMLPSKGERS